MNPGCAGAFHFLIMSKTPYEVAADIARQLQNDPIAAAQVKEHLGEKWLLELLEVDQTPLKVWTPETPDKTVEYVVNNLPIKVILGMALARFFGKISGRIR